MSLPFSSFVVVLCLGAGFVSIPLPVRSLPVNAIAQSRSNPTSAEGWVNRGVEKLEQGDVQGAIADFDRAIRINPNYADAYGNRGIAYSRLGDYPNAIANYDYFLLLKPDVVEFYYNRGIAYDKLGYYQNAIADYDRAIRLNPNFTQAISSREVAQNKLRTARQSTSNPNANAQSSSKLRTARDFLNQGMNKYNKADFDGAIVDFSQAIQLKPDYIEAYLIRSSAYLGLTDLENAIADLRKAVDLFQKQGDTARYQVHLDLLKATETLNNSIAQSDSRSKLAFAEKFFILGAENYKKENFVQAIACLNQAIHLNPEWAQAYLARSIAYSQLKEYQKAIADLDKVIRLNPSNADAYSLRGLFYVILGDTRKGTPNLQKAATLFRQQGNTAQAQRVLDFLKKLRQ